MVKRGQTQGALSGIKILDLSRVLAGPWATQILGDLGAGVIKVEQPNKGDDTRAWGPPYFDDGHGGERQSAYFMACNRNKKSIVVDFSKPEGAEIIRKLASSVDVVVENFKVGGLKKFGLDEASLRAINPNLIYCSITGFGPTGPYAHRGGYDLLMQAMGGLMSLTGPAAGQPGSEPTKVGVPVIDLFTGLYAAVSILAALHHRTRTGEGQLIDCALLDTALAILANQGMNYLLGGTAPQRKGNAHPNVVPYRNFETADGEVIVAVGNDGQFIKFCQLLGRADLAENPRYAANSMRVLNRVELEMEISDALLSWRRDDLVRRMSERGVPGGPINRVDQAFADPQVKARHVVELHSNANGVDIPFTRYPSLLSATPAKIRTVPPALGEHTHDVLRDWLKLGPAEIKDLEEQSVIQDRMANMQFDRKVF
ncbi:MULTISPECIES: CaiB/BaiF CoA-transferase family protein [unclassified Mesorhizobium]|uniref:CaiB/BaiF CoA transferase family protein n=1 Tax=unclassified Mesorhizobium TaxID=325217 RepID=UPI0011284DE9|nr:MULTISPECIES: CaiB/BaiF CoA-transferase family protein [unclassified Mesorhizobium]TPL00750.1 CoA transferase [Mesorhizobium sp. B2-4-16]TPL76989.1 CoA transferase [Mesorhizobium sp. B2-4-3]